MINLFEVKETNEMIEKRIWTFVPLPLESVLWTVSTPILTS